MCPYFEGSHPQHRPIPTSRSDPSEHTVADAGKEESSTLEGRRVKPNFLEPFLCAR
jgi:hypothetical protein